MNSILSKTLTGVGACALGILVGRTTANMTPTEEERVSISHREQNNVSSSRSVSSEDSSGSVKSFFDAISPQQYELMVENILSSDDPRENENLLGALLSEWSKEDPEAALALASGHDRYDLVYGCLQQMSKERPDDALQWIEQNAKTSQVYYLTMSVYEGFAKRNPTAAVARVQQLEPGGQRDRFLAISVDEWARQDVHAVFDWIGTTEITPELNYIYSQTMGHYINQNPLDAAFLIAAMEPSENKVGFSTQVATKLAEQDVKSALEWVESNLQGDAHSYSLLGVLDRWASGPNAADALDFLMADRNRANYDDLFATVAIKMVYNKPDELTVALNGMQESEQITAVKYFTRICSVNDPSKCNELIATLKPGTVRDTAVVGAVSSYKTGDPSFAFSLSETISDKTVREEQIRKIMTEWLATKPEEARRALDMTSVLSASEKELLLDQVYSDVKPHDYFLPEQR